MAGAGGARMLDAMTPETRMSSRLWAVVTKTMGGYIDDDLPRMGAALAYYTLFSIAPLLLIVISIAGLAFGPDAARGHIFAELRDLMGEEGAAAAQALLQSVNKPAQGVLGTIVGVVLLGVGAISVFGELQNALDRIWRAPGRAGSGGLWALVRARLLSFGMVLGIGFLLILSLVASAAIAALGKFAAPWFGSSAVLVELLDLVLSLAFVTVTFAMIYKIVPRVRIGWRDVWVGAAVTALLFSIGKSLIGLYLGRSTFASGFGAAGSLVVLLVWMYYSAQIFLFGAEFTWVYAHTHGSRSKPGSAAGGAGAETTIGEAAAALARSRSALEAAMQSRRPQ
jgi:membrane protein